MSVPSPVTGVIRVVWTGEPKTLKIPLFEGNVPDLQVKRPKAYWVPPAWHGVIERLRLHGIAMERLDRPRAQAVTMLRVETHELASAPFEGRMRVSATFREERHEPEWPAGTVRVPVDQPLGTLAVHLLDPRAPDSFFAWGFFLEILQRTEYAENYAMDPLAERMLQSDPELKKEYEAKLKAEPDFAKDPEARLAFFYEKTRYFDARFKLYPVGLE